VKRSFYEAKTDKLAGSKRRGEVMVNVALPQDKHSRYLREGERERERERDDGNGAQRPR
jgi:hypothetical protein